MKGLTDKKIRDDANNSKLGGLVKNFKAPYRRLILDEKRTSSWMTVQSTVVTGTVLAVVENLDFLWARYYVNPFLNFKKYILQKCTRYYMVKTDDWWRHVIKALVI